MGGICGDGSKGALGSQDSRTRIAITAQTAKISTKN